MRNRITPSVLLFSNRKDTNFHSFMKVSSQLEPISQSLILKLSKHFNLSPRVFVSLIDPKHLEGFKNA